MFVHDFDVQLPVANPDVIYRAVSDGAVLLSPRDEVYFGLNGVGARIWELLPPSTTTLTDLCLALHRTYPSVDLGTLRRDTLELLHDLVKSGLAMVADAEQAA
jgi:hypothetical protein